MKRLNLLPIIALIAGTCAAANGPQPEPAISQVIPPPQVLNLDSSWTLMDRYERFLPEPNFDISFERDV